MQKKLWPVRSAGPVGRSGWPVRPAWLDSPVSWGPGLCCSWASFQKPFPTSAPTFEDFKRLEGGGMGQGGEGKGSHYGGEWSSRGL